MIPIIIFAVIAYLCGSLSSAVIVCKLLHLPDPRQEGSGNPGAANVLRIAGKKAAILVLIGDVLKGCIPVLLARLFHINGFSLGLVALAAVFGHIYPIFFRFKGGKGVATFAGTTLALSFMGGVAFGLAWLIVAFIFRYASLASLISSLLSLIYLTIFVKVSYFFPILAIFLLILWKHQGNLKRLKAGTERKIKLSH